MQFYYEPTYEGGGNGSETCVKQNGASNSLSQLCHLFLDTKI